MENNDSQGMDLTIDTDEEETQKYQHLNLNRLITEPDNKIGLTDTDLVVIKTKDLNNKLKQTTDLRREDKDKIKKKRRTIKNRGYAAGSRYKRNCEEKTLKNEKQKIEDEIRRKEEDKDNLEEKLAKLRESTRFRVAWSHAQGIDLPEEYYKYLDEKK